MSNSERVIIFGEIGLAEQLDLWSAGHEGLSIEWFEVHEVRFDVPVANVLVYIGDSSHLRFGQFGQLLAHDWSEYGNLFVRFLDGKQEAFNDRNPKIKKVFKDVLTDSDREMLARIQPGIEKLFKEGK